MMMRFRRREHQVPGLNTASLPDLIFTVLFFFMIVTHMRKEEVRVKYRIPQGTELTRLTKKSTVCHIYIGSLTKGGPSTHIQVNDKLVKAEELEDYIVAEKERLAPEERQQFTVSLRADEDTPMQVINEVKMALRRSNTLRINYAATSKKQP